MQTSEIAASQPSLEKAAPNSTEGRGRGASAPPPSGPGGPPLGAGVEAVLAANVLSGDEDKAEMPPRGEQLGQNLETGSKEEQLREPRALAWRR